MKKLIALLTLFLVNTATALALDDTSNIAPYYCSTQFWSQRDCLKEKVVSTYSYAFGRMDRIVCEQYAATATNIWWISMTNAEGKQFHGGSFPDSSAAINRLNQLIQIGYCQ